MTASNLQRRLEKRQNNPGCLKSIATLAAGVAFFVVVLAGILAIASLAIMVGWGLLAPYFPAEPLAFSEAFGISLLTYVFTLLYKGTKVFGA